MIEIYKREVLCVCECMCDEKISIHKCQIDVKFCEWIIIIFDKSLTKKKSKKNVLDIHQHFVSSIGQISSSSSFLNQLSSLWWNVCYSIFFTNFFFSFMICLPKPNEKNNFWNFCNNFYPNVHIKNETFN